MARPLTWAIVLILFVAFIFVGQMCAFQLREVGKLALNQPAIEVSADISGSFPAVSSVKSSSSVEKTSASEDSSASDISSDARPKTFWQRLTGLFQISSPQKTRQEQLRQKVQDGEMGPREAVVKMYQNQV